MSVDSHPPCAGMPRDRAGAFVAAYVLCHLHVIVVGTDTFRRLNGAVELGVVLVHEIECVFITSEERCGAVGLAVGEKPGGILPCCPLVPVIEVNEIGIDGEGLVPSVLEIYPVSLGMLHGFPKPGHIRALHQIIFVQRRLPGLQTPAFACDRHGMLPGSDRHLLYAPAMCGRTFQRLAPPHGRIVHLIAETPVVFSAGIRLAAPLVVTPPHIAHREEILHLAGIVAVEFIGIIGIAVMRMGRICSRLRVVVGIRVRNSSPVGIEFRPHVAEEQRLAIPVEPEVAEFPLTVIALEDLLRACDHRTVVAPETDFRHRVTLVFHLLEGGEKLVPLFPVAHGIGDIKYYDINSGIGEHGDILTYHITVGAEEISGFRLPPVVASHIARRSPQTCGIGKPCLRISLENIGHIPVTGGGIIQEFLMPSDIENADSARLTLPGGICRRLRHSASKAVCGHPGVRHKIARRGCGAPEGKRRQQQ